MISFAEILKETNQVMQMHTEFSATLLTNTQPKQNAPCISIPAVETTQGEQKAPVAKPNGVTR